MKIVKQNQMKIVTFGAVKNRCILHGRVFIMEAVLTCTHDLCFERKKKTLTIFHLKNTVFTVVENRSILHMRITVLD